MTTPPPGSTAYVRFETVPLLTILRGPDAAAGFASAALTAPGSTRFVAFDTVPGLWFDFPPSATTPAVAPPVPVAAVGQAAAPAGQAAGKAADQAAAPAHVRRPVGRDGGAAQRPRERRVGRTLAATGGDETSTAGGLALLAAAWLVRRGRGGRTTAPDHHEGAAGQPVRAANT